MRTISNFPHLTVEEFAQGCEQLAGMISSPTLARSGLTASVIKDPLTRQEFLKVCKQLRGVGQHSSDTVTTNHEKVDEVLEDSDEAALVRPATQELRAEYHIILSAVYRVPVLYFFVHGLEQPSPRSPLNQVKKLIVPPSLQDQIDGVGVLGAISHCDHPILNTPVFFVHPCNTATALVSVADGRGINVTAYMLIWLGMVGHCVGLNVPVRAHSPHLCAE